VVRCITGHGEEVAAATAADRRNRPTPLPGWAKATDHADPPGAVSRVAQEATRSDVGRIAHGYWIEVQSAGDLLCVIRYATDVKKKTLRASEQDRPDIATARAVWKAECGTWDVKQLVFLDESGAKTNMVRLRGRAPRGERVYDAAPHGHWCSTTMLSAIRCDGSTACLVLEGSTDTDVFQTYVQKVLIPALRPGDCVIMDNLAPHKTAAVERLLADAGVSWRWLPPYSPDLNPIEKMWSKVKTFLRAAKARSPEALLAAIGKALKTITPQDAAHWYASCGYTIT